MALLSAFEKCLNAAPIWPAYPLQYVVMAIEHERKFALTHTRNPFPKIRSNKIAKLPNTAHRVVYVESTPRCIPRVH